MDSEDKELCLQWNSHSEVFQSTFGELLNSEEFADVTISCQGKTIRCHKVVLSICSSYFRTLLLQNEHPHPLVIMSDVKYDDLVYILKFMYTGEITVPQSQLGSLVSVADILKVKGLAETENESIPSVAQEQVQTKKKRKEPSGSLIIDECDLSRGSESPVPPKKLAKTAVKEPKPVEVSAPAQSSSQSIQTIETEAQVTVKAERDDNSSDVPEGVRDDNENINLEILKIKSEEGEGEAGLSILQSELLETCCLADQKQPTRSNRAVLLTDEELRDIGDSLNRGEGLRQIAKRYSLSFTTIWKYAQRNGYRSLRPACVTKRLSKESKNAVLQALDNGETLQTVARRFEISEFTVKKIRRQSRPDYKDFV